MTADVTDEGGERMGVMSYVNGFRASEIEWWV